MPDQNGLRKHDFLKKVMTNSTAKHGSAFIYASIVVIIKRCLSYQ